MSSVISDVELKSHIDRTIVSNNFINELKASKKFRFVTYKNLLVLCLATFPPPPDFENYLEMYLRNLANKGIASVSSVVRQLRPISQKLADSHGAIVLSIAGSIALCGRQLGNESLERHE